MPVIAEHTMKYKKALKLFQKEHRKALLSVKKG
jgi:hypothetical protein